MQFFDAAYQNFVSAKGKQKFFYGIVGYTLCLECAGDKIAEKLIPALEHLRIDPPEKCDFTMCIWDSASSGAPDLKLPWPKGNHALRGEVVDYNDTRFFTVVDIHTKVLHMI